MSLLALFSFAVLAAETIISPLPDDGIVTPPPQPAPEVSFGQLIDYTPQVLGVTTETSPQTPTPTPSPSAALTKEGLSHRKNAYTIAVLGDSMVDTLGPGVPNLKTDLTRLYPNVTFNILNYGVGGENIESGISRLTNDYDYLGNHIPSLISRVPDIVVVESFGYNPFIEPASELDRHWLDLSKIVDTLRGNVPGIKIVIAATIAPNASIFGDGALNWGSQQKQEKVSRINNLIENAIKFAKSQKLPLADAYTPSGGSIEFINPGDHIHYSDKGRELFGKVVSDTIISNKLLE